MAKKKRAVPAIRAEATAKAELIAKASYRRTHTTTEVIPPDVTRAKASAWLDLISPITEWAGLKGDQLRNKRLLLRVQQEETLLRIAESVRKKLGDTEIVRPVPPKILVPALEVASLEDPSDDVMIGIWASLLASAASGAEVEPKYVAILRELSGRQAKMLRSLATYHADRFDFPYEKFSDSEYSLEFGDFSDDFRKKFPPNELTPLDQVDEFLDEVLNLPGSVVDLAYVDFADGRREALDVSGVAMADLLTDRESAFICLTLGLIAKESGNIIGRYTGGSSAGTAALRLSYYRFTLLGATLIELCDPEALVELKKVEWELHIESLRTGSA
jgi:hypothetical protein